MHDQARLEVLALEVQRLERRVRWLEEHGGASARASHLDPEAPEPAARGGEGLMPQLVLFGRTLLALAGGYLLRALSDGGVLPPRVGVALGLLYAVLLLWLADRAGKSGLKASATFHGATAVLIGYPLLAETSAWKRVLPLWIAALGTGTLAGLSLAVAARRALAPLAWLGTLVALSTAWILLVRTRDPVPAVVILLCVAGAVELQRGSFAGLRWPAALALDLALPIMATVTRSAEGPPGPRAAETVIALGLPALYLTTLAAPAAGRRIVAWFEVVQGGLALAIDVGCAARLQVAAGQPLPWLGGGCLVLALTAYAVAFRDSTLRDERPRNYYFFGALAGLLTLRGTAWLLSGATLGLVWGALAIGTLGVGARLERASLYVQGALFTLASFVATGLAASAMAGLVAPAAALPAVPGLAVASAGLLATGAGLMLTGRRTTTADIAARTTVLAVVVLAAGGLAVLGLAPLLPQTPEGTPDPGFLAAARTAVLSLGAVGLLWLGKRDRLAELKLLAPVLLVGCGFKILAEDLRAGRPSSLFVMLVCYGAALVVTPRLWRSALPVRIRKLSQSNPT